ncbi:plasminogen activator inhibitor 1 RNA-binding protein [Microdochium nivale]|nr:plasminogen activator inhibitor 1 RNA-binding protein [Microdochium nivale]
MRFSSTLAAALVGVAPFVVALPMAAPAGAVVARNAGAMWSRGAAAAQPAAAQPAAGHAAAQPAAEAGAGAGAGKGKGAQQKQDDNDNNDNDDDNNDDDDRDNRGNGANRGAADRGQGADRGADRGQGADRGADRGQGADRGADRGQGADRGNGAGAGAGGEAAAGEEAEIAGAFGQLIDLKGDDLKQDILFKAAVGNFEVEFQAKTARKVAVIENKTPGAAPAGFKQLDPSSFIVTFQGGGGDLTLGQLDYIFDAANPALAGLDLTKTTIGKFSNEKKAFEVGDRVGETEFEVEENEIVLKVRNLSGEFALFIPDAAAAAPRCSSRCSSCCSSRRASRRSSRHYNRCSPCCYFFCCPRCYCFCCPCCPPGCRGGSCC